MMKNNERKVEIVKAAIASYPDFPKPGIVFEDIFGVYANVEAFTALNDLITEKAKSHKSEVDVVVGLGSRGFLIGPTMAMALNVPFVPIRKKGKLPGEVSCVKYDLEYGSNEMEIQKSSIRPGDKVLIVDDLLATGGTMEAACKLVKGLNGKIIEVFIIIELGFLKGRNKLQVPVSSLIQYE